MRHATSLFRLLADPTRLRLLRVVAQDRFNVTELTSILALAQSGVSRHLGLLADAGLLDEEREAGFVYYRIAADARESGHTPLWALLDAQFVVSESDRAVREDEARLQEVLRHRKENFDAHGDQRQLVPGQSWAAWARALGHLLPPMDVVDIGCGEGYITLELAAWARTVTGIDRSDDVLQRARAMATRRRVTNVDWKKGDLSRLPIRDASVDLALLAQSLHYASDTERAMLEAVRVVRPGGRILVIDLKTHDQAWVRTRFGDQKLGFSRAELEDLLAGAGLTNVRVTTGTKKAGDPFAVMIASAVKAPEVAASTRARASRSSDGR